jgi:hypothetical protein
MVERELMLVRRLVAELVRTLVRGRLVETGDAEQPTVHDVGRQVVAELVLVQHDAHPLDVGQRPLHPGRGVGALKPHGLAVDLELGACRPADDHLGLAFAGADQHERREVAQPSGDQGVEGDVEPRATVHQLPEPRDARLLGRRQDHDGAVADDPEPVAGPVGAHGVARWVHGSAPSFCSRLARCRSES